METTLIASTYAIVSVVLVSLISLVGIITLLLRDNWLQKILFALVSLSAGALFGDAIIHLIPEAFSNIISASIGSFWVIAGIVLFFAFEKFFRWRHTHGNEEEEIREGIDPEKGHVQPVGSLVIISDGVHNLIDGLIIGASYLVGIDVGIATTIAIILHEIPQEIGDFAILIHAGFSKTRALLINFFSALTSVVGAVVALFLGSYTEAFIPYIVAFAAGSFLYIAGSDLVPEIHKTSDVKRSIIQFVALLLGIGIMFGLLFFE